MNKKKNKKKTEDCKHQWAPLLAKVGKKTIPSLARVCLRCGELKIGEKTIRVSRFRLDMGGLPIENLGAPSVDTDAPRAQAGDVLSGRFPVDRLPAMTDEKIWKGTGANVEEVDMPVAAGGYAQATAGNSLRTSNDGVVTTTNSSPTKVKEIRLGRIGVYRIKFDLDADPGASQVKAQLYKNGVAVGTERTGGEGAGYQTFSEDLNNWTTGDLCQVYAWRVTGGATAYVRNFRIYVDKLETYT